MTTPFIAKYTGLVYLGNTINVIFDIFVCFIIDTLRIFEKSIDARLYQMIDMRSQDSVNDIP